MDKSTARFPWNEISYNLSGSIDRPTDVIGPISLNIFIKREIANAYKICDSFNYQTASLSYMFYETHDVKWNSVSRQWLHILGRRRDGSSPVMKIYNMKYFILLYYFFFFQIIRARLLMKITIHIVFGSSDTYLNCWTILAYIVYLRQNKKIALDRVIYLNCWPLLANIIYLRKKNNSI